MDPKSAVGGPKPNSRTRADTYTLLQKYKKGGKKKWLTLQEIRLIRIRTDTAPEKTSPDKAYYSHKDDH